MGKKQKRASDLLDVFKKQAKNDYENKTNFDEKFIPYIEEIYDLTKNTYMSIFCWIGIGSLKDACLNMTDVKELYRKIDNKKFEDYITMIDEFIELCIVRLHCYIQQVHGQSTWLDYLKEIQDKDFYIRHAEEFAPYTQKCVEYCLKPNAFFDYRPKNYISDGGKIYQGIDAAFAQGNPNSFAINLDVLSSQIPEKNPTKLNEIPIELKPIELNRAELNSCERCKKHKKRTYLRHLFKIYWLPGEPFVCWECNDILDKKREKILDEKTKEAEESDKELKLTKAEHLELYKSIRDF